MKQFTIKSHFTYNRRNNRQKIVCDQFNKLFLPKKTMIFAELSENVTEKDSLDHVFKKKHEGVLTSYDFELNLAIIHNTTFEDILIDKEEPIFVLKEQKSNKKSS